MSGCRLFSVVVLTKRIHAGRTPLLCSPSVLDLVQRCGYAKRLVAKGKGKGMVKEELKGPEVCKDPVRLTTYAVGANIFKEGEDPQLKPFEEYPEWLLNLNLGPPKQLSELEEDSWAYQKRLRKENIWRHNRLSKAKKF